MMIDDEMLMAYADGELDASDRQAVEEALTADVQLRERLQTQRHLRVTLTSYYGPVASEQVPERLLALLGAERPPSDVSSLADARAKRRPLRTQSWFNWGGAVAASLAVGFFGGQMLRDQGPVGTRDGMLVAEGKLAKALETQLASAQTGAGDTRIRLTFADHEGHICRTFEARDLSGLACRRDGGWNLITTAAPSRQATEYRQAGSMAVIQAAQQIMASEPLDAEEEKAAMEAGWRIAAPAKD
jgi:hypothetical protein